MSYLMVHISAGPPTFASAIVRVWKDDWLYDLRELIPSMRPGTYISTLADDGVPVGHDWFYLVQEPQ